MTINYSAISRETIFGKVLRLPLKLLPKNLIIPIIQGEIRGYKWIIGSGVNGYWLGSYELKKVSLFIKTIKDKKLKVIYDIGAHVGYYTLISSKCVGDTGIVYSFEPNPQNIFYLKKHIEINKVNNVNVVETAVSDFIGEANFDTTSNTSMGKIADKGVKIRSITIDYFVFENNNNPPEIMKIDIEGAELDALRGAKETITKFHPIIFLSLHSNELYKECKWLLNSYSYKIQDFEDNEIIAF
jgi:FkbM family methyltransferase